MAARTALFGAWWAKHSTSGMGRMCFAVGLTYWGQTLFHFQPRKSINHRHVEGVKVDLRSLATTPRVVFRLVQLFLAAIPLLLLYPLISAMPSLRVHYYNFLCATLESLGPGFVKLGQWAVTREDLVAPEVRQALCRLHDSVAPHSEAYTREVIKEDLGIENLDEVFLDFDPVPIGSGSIAQVHKAVLKENGHVVVIKVRHPKVRERIAVDFACLKMAADAINPYLDLIDLGQVADQFEENLSTQVDLRIEKGNLETFLHNFSHLPFGIEFPKPYPKYCTSRVLTETFIEGTPLKNIVNDPNYTEVTRRRFAKIGTELFMQMLVTDNFFHADLHQGNFLIGCYDDEHKKPYIGLLDAGITHTLNEAQQMNIFKCMQAIQLKQSDCVADCILRMSPNNSKRHTPEQEAAFKVSVEELFDGLMEDRRKSGTMKQRWLAKFGILSSKANGLTEVFQGVFEKARIHRVQIDAVYSSLLFNSIMLEEVVNIVDPEWDIVQATLPWLLSTPLQRILGLEKNQASVGW